MTDEEIERFALVLKECARIRALIAREEAALSNGELDDGIPRAAAPPEQRPPGLTRATDAWADKGYSPECVEKLSEKSKRCLQLGASSEEVGPILETPSEA